MLLPMHLHTPSDPGLLADHDEPLHSRDCVAPLLLSIIAALLALALLGADWRGSWLDPEPTLPQSTRTLIMTPQPR